MVTDFHSHILPQTDDGSESLEMSLAMLREEASQGVTHVVATPHFYAKYDTLPHFLEKRARAEALLRQEAAKDPRLPQISVGAEVYFFRGISDSEVLPQLTIGGKSCMLIEMPQPPWPEEMYRELENIHRKRGIIPIIAHIDRYVAPLRTYKIPQRLSQLPVLVQANAAFFLDRSTAAMAMKMLKAGQIHLLGSDCHNMSDRKPNLALAVERIRRKLGQEALDEIQAWEDRITKQ